MGSQNSHGEYILKKSQTKIDKLSPEQLKAIAPSHAAAAVVAPKAEKSALNDDKNRKKLTPGQTEEELKALEQADQVAEVAGEPIELVAAEAVATDAATGGVVAAETTSGLVGGAAVAGGVGTGAVAGGALVGAAALNNGGGDGSVAAQRELTAVNVKLVDESFNQQNVIADVVDIEADSVFVGTIAAAASTTTISEAQTNGGSQTTTGVAEAAVSVTIASIENISVGGFFASAVDARQLVSTQEFVVSPIKMNSDSIGIQSQEVSLTSELGSVFVSDIGGGGSFLETRSESFQQGDVNNPDTLTSSFTSTLKVDAADSVTITASKGNVSVGGWRDELSMPGIHASMVEITAESAGGEGELNIDGGYEASRIRSFTNFASEPGPNQSQDLPFEYVDTSTVFAADSVTINPLAMGATLSETVGSVFGADIQSKVTVVNADSLWFATFGGGSKYVFEDSFDPKVAEAAQYTYVDTFTQSASDSVTLNVLSGVEGTVDVSAERFTSTAGFYRDLSVDGGYVEDFDSGVTVAEAAASVNIKATSTTSDSFVDVFALEGTIVTAGASGATGSTGDVIEFGASGSTGDYVIIRNAEGQAQEITIDLGQGENDFIDFEGYDYLAIDTEASSVAQNGVLTLVFTDGETTDTFTVSNVENFSFDNGVTASYEQLASIINANIVQAV